MIRFADPLWFLLLLVPILRIWSVRRDTARGYGTFVMTLPASVRGRFSKARAFRWLPLTLEIAAFVLLTVAMARPQRVTTAGDQRSGIDIIITLDASGSMAAEDFRPRNRFEVAKELIGEFIDQRTSDRIGLVTFGARAATRVPVTFDHQIARTALEQATVGENGDGTAIGHAIATSVNRLRNSAARSRIIVLITDGVNNAGSIEPATAAALAARFGIRIYAIGVGSRGAVPIPVKVQNRFTGEIETEYQFIRADLDEEMLSGISRSTGGTFFRATDENALAAVFQQIDRLERTRLTAPAAIVAEELYPPLVAAAVMTLLVSLLGSVTVWMRLAT